MQIDIDRNINVPIYVQIKNKIKDMILKGYLPDGYKLLPERKLAEQLGVNRSTVLNAYSELKAEGLLESCVGQGTIVNTKQNIENSEGFEKPDVFHWKQFLSENVSRMREAVSIDIMEIANRKDIISFAAGIADSKLDPVENFNIIQQELLKEYGSEIFRITPTNGINPLRESISDFIKHRGINANTNEIMVLSGSQQGIEFTARALINPGDVVIVEEPTFFCALQVFKALGARIIAVPVDKNGMRTDILEALLKRYKPVLIYTMPTFQNPTGFVMSIERRKHLLNLAYKYQIPILEDDAYYELRYEGKDIPTLKALDSYGYVIYLSSFSKIMFQGLRVGWMVSSPAFIEQISMIKQMCDLHSSSLPQWIIDGFYRRQLIPKHIELLKENYALRRDIMLKALEENKVKGVEWSKPEGGLYIWCKLPEDINMSALMLRAVSNKVTFLPGNVCYADSNSEKYIRLNFTFTTEEETKIGIKKLMDAVESTLKEFRRNKSDESVEIKPVI